MKRLVRLAAVAALFVCATSASAQWKGNVTGGVVLPNGDLGKSFSTGFGLMGYGKYSLNDNMAVGGGVGYYIFDGKDAADGSTLAMMPFVGNFTYYFLTEGLRPYAGLDAGIYFEQLEYEFLGTTEKYNGIKLGFAPVIGCEYAINDKYTLDLNVKYNYINNGLEIGDVKISDKAATSLGINIGVTYNLGE